LKTRNELVPQAKQAFSILKTVLICCRHEQPKVVEFPSSGTHYARQMIMYCFLYFTFRLILVLLYCHWIYRPIRIPP